MSREDCDLSLLNRTGRKVVTVPAHVEDSPAEVLHL